MDSISQKEVVQYDNDILNQENPKCNLITNIGESKVCKNIEPNLIGSHENLKKSKKRCSHPDCSKKIKLTDMECRCEKIFCLKHRLPENHSCDFDYKSLEKEILRKSLNKVVAEKIAKI
jgi:predicted nucleic acid binding AN1-type Zn finger protein